MTTTPTFSGSVPNTYHTFLGPMIFDSSAKDMTARLARVFKPQSGVLELAAGTGIVTKQVLAALPPTAKLTVTDISEPMLGVAKAALSDPRLTFQPADACRLPFADLSFDTLLCQYGVMFFPDKVQAMKEARRALAPAGTYVFNIWDSFEHNPIPHTVHQTLATLTPANPIPFLAKMPFGYSDRAEIERVTRAGGFTNFKLDTVEFPCSAPSAADAARAWVEGTPIFAALTERGITDTTPVRTAVEKALAAKFGSAPCRSTMRAIVVTAS